MVVAVRGSVHAFLGKGGVRILTAAEAKREVGANSEELKQR